MTNYISVLEGLLFVAGDDGISLEEASSDKYIEILESFKEIKKFIAQKINDKTTDDKVKSFIKRYFNI